LAQFNDVKRAINILRPLPRELRCDQLSRVGFPALLFWIASVATCSSTAAGAERAALRSGQDIYRAACAGCHGGDGAGAERSLIGFEPPETFPDFTRCDQTTPEEDTAWLSVIRDGGPSRGFSQIMPAFGDALSPQQIESVLSWLRSFCADAGWPRGELNLPRALATEKAFPESETVLTSAFNAQGAPGIDSELVYEYRLGKRDQLEVAVPFSFVRKEGGDGLTAGIGDVALGLKHVVYSRLAADGSRGSILSFQGEVALPTGDRTKGFGTGQPAFTAFAAYDALFQGKAFVQLQGGLDMPHHTHDVPRSAFLRAALGKSLSEREGYGRTWSPMLELVGARDLKDGARTQWDVIPELQVTLNDRQHVRADLGFRIPVSEKEARPRQIMLYFLWDWFDGGLFDGW
jgi:mono/diheme cytochrome c family protein